MLSIEVNCIMLSMCRLFDDMILLLLILSCVDHWMGLMFISLLLVMCTFEVHFILPLLLSHFVGFKKIWPFLVGGWFAFPSWLVDFSFLNWLAGLFYSTTFGRYFVYMSIVYFVYYGLVQIFIFLFWIFVLFVSLERLCLGSLLVFWVWSFCLMSWFLIWVCYLFMVHLPKSHLWGNILKRQRWWIQL